MPQQSSERFELGQSYPKPSTPHEGQRSFAPAEPRPLLPLAEDHKHGVQNWLMRPHNQRVDRKSLPSIPIAPKPRAVEHDRAHGHETVRLHPDTQQRIEEPTDQRPLREDEIGAQEHVSLKWYGLAERVDIRPVEPG